MMNEQLLEEKVKQFTPMCHKLANEYSRKTRVDKDDLFQEAVIGLLKAIKRYDSEVNENEFTYYYGSAKGYIINYIRDKQKVVRTPALITDSVNKVFRLGLEESSAEIIALELDIDIKLAKEVREYIDVKGEVKYLDFKYNSNDGDEEVDLYSKLKTEDRYSCELELAMSRLKEHERTAMEMHVYGYSQTEIGDRLGFNQGKVSRVINAARSTLKKELGLQFN